MPRLLKHSLIVVALAALALPGLSRAQDEETVKATHGNWDVICATNQEDLCVIRQVGTNADGKKVLEVRIRKLTDVKTQDGKQVPAAIQITTPLGSILRAGVRVQIDASEPRTGAFEVCIPNGCVVRDAMSEEFLGQLKAGSTAKMSFGVLQMGEVNVEISLKGFTKAFGEL